VHPQLVSELDPGEFLAQLTAHYGFRVQAENLSHIFRSQQSEMRDVPAGF